MLISPIFWVLELIPLLTATLSFSVPSGGTDTVQTFLGSGTGTNGFAANGTLSTAGIGVQSAFFFTGGNINPLGANISVLHDDGFSLYLGSHLEFSSAAPTSRENGHVLS